MSYISVASIDDFPPGSAKLLETDSLEIALYNVEGAVYATSNVCPHQGASLADGELNGEEILCPWHRWCFNVKDGVSPLNPRLKVKTYAVKLEGKKILIDLPDKS
jgi:nitrite reductase/ring-hydroxylating ferredoxin subunit